MVEDFESFEHASSCKRKERKSSSEEWRRTSVDPQFFSKHGTLMDANKDIKLAIGLNRFNLRLLGVWPDPSTADVGFTKYSFLIPIALMVTFIFGPQSANLFIIWGDIDLITENLATANIPTINAILKLLFIWYHRNELKPLLRAFMDDWHRNKTDMEQSIMLKNALTARKIAIGCNILTQVMVTAFLSLRIIAVFQLDKSTVTPDRCALYPAYFPYDIRTSPQLELTCLAQIITAYCTSTAYTAVDSFISMLVLHACGQYSNLAETLRSLFDEMSCEGTKRLKEFREELAAIVRRHDHLNWSASHVILLTLTRVFKTVLKRRFWYIFQYLQRFLFYCFNGCKAFLCHCFFHLKEQKKVTWGQTRCCFWTSSTEKAMKHELSLGSWPKYWFSETIEESFNVLLLAQMLACSVQLCFQGFLIFRLLLQEDGAPPTFRLLFLGLSVAFIALHLYIYCYVGEKLLVQSTALNHVAYCSKWFNAPPQDARNLLLVMIRSTKPLRLTAGKFSTLCLETYANILKTSIGYLSVLVAVSGNMN